MTSTIRFFKFITRTNLEDGKLRIPLGFTRKHGDDMSNPLFLKPPDGKEWKIYWAKHDGDILFQKGWKHFSTHYSLGHGHIVFFEYEEETCQFGVNIFNKSTLEIEYPINDIQDEQHNLNHINEEDSVDILDEPTQCKKTRPKSPISCQQPQKKLRTDTSDDVGRSSKVSKMPENVQVNELDNTCVSIECLKVEQDQEQEELTSKLKAALDRASNFKSANPFYIFVMKPSYLYNTFLHVPSEFAKKYLKKQERDILLQVLDGRTWHCKYRPGKIGGVWKKFILDNNLKVGDVCVFELINSQELTLKVLIFHVQVEEELHSPLPQESVDGDGARTPCVGSKTVTTNKGGKGTQRTSPGEEVNFTSKNPSLTNEALNEANKITSKNPFFIVNIEPNRRRRIYRPTIPSAFIKKYNLVKKENLLLQFGKNLWPVKLTSHHSKSRTRLLSRGWYLFTNVSKLQAGDTCVFELINKKDGVLHVHIFRGGKATQRTSPGEEANKFTLENLSFINEALKEANEFTSENPFFIVQIDPNQLRKYYRPYIPIAFMRKYLDKKEIVLLQFGKNLWPVKLNSYNSSKPMSPRLSRGWILFAEESKLEAGDVCVFELIKREDAVLHVHIFRGH